MALYFGDESFKVHIRMLKGEKGDSGDITKDEVEVIVEEVLDEQMHPLTNLEIEAMLS